MASGTAWTSWREAPAGGIPGGGEELSRTAELFECSKDSGNVRERSKQVFGEWLWNASAFVLNSMNMIPASLFLSSSPPSSSS